MLRRATTALALLAALPALADGPKALRHDWALDGAVTGGALAAALVLELAKERLAPPACAWCEPGGLDRGVREAVVWSDRRAAATASDVLAVAVPAGVLLQDWLSARAAGDPGAALADALVITESVALAGLLTQGAKLGVARLRPYAWYAGGTRTPDDHLSFWSGHTSVAFSAAAAGGTVARLRGYRAWPWVYGIGFGAAALTGYLRMAGDKHWLLDVLAGAVVGTAVGIAVPLLHGADPAPAGQQPLRLAPVPGGLVLAGTF